SGVQAAAFGYSPLRRSCFCFFGCPILLVLRREGRVLCEGWEGPLSHRRLLTSAPAETLELSFRGARRAECAPFFPRDEESLLAFHPSQIILLDQRRHQKPCHSEEPRDEESLLAFVDARFFGLTKSRRFSHRRLLISAPRHNL